VIFVFSLSALNLAVVLLTLLWALACQKKNYLRSCFFKRWPHEKTALKIMVWLSMMMIFIHFVNNLKKIPFFGTTYFCLNILSSYFRTDKIKWNINSCIPQIILRPYKISIESEYSYSVVNDWISFADWSLETQSYEIRNCRKVFKIHEFEQNKWDGYFNISN